METLRSPITIIGLLALSILFLAGLFLFFGMFSLSKVIPPRHRLNRQAGKGLFIQVGATLGYNLIGIFAVDWNGWIKFIVGVWCIIVMFMGLRIFMPAMKEINRVAREQTSSTNT